MTESTIHLLRGALGMAAFLGIAWACSVNRRAINWRLVGAGILLQLLIGATVLHVTPVRTAFGVVGAFFIKLMSFTNEGVELVFGWLTDIAGGNVDNLAFTQGGPIFAVTILPSIMFFAAFTSALYRLGILQVIVFGFAWMLSKTMKLSGAETLSTAANIFVGQTEAPLLIKPYLATMTRSEILTIMVGGMANIAGGVMAAYIVFLGGSDPQEQMRWATHLLTASVISAPAAVVISKMLVPQTHEINRALHLAEERPGENLIDAICLGAWDGLKLAVNVGVMLIVFTAFVALVNWILADGVGVWTGLNDMISSLTGGRYSRLTMEFLLGLVGAPVAWLLGIDSPNLLVAGQLLGERTVLNEFYAYLSMNRLQASGVLTDDRTRVILTYALCGFANIVSIGIQIGGIGALAPNKRGELARLGWLALLGGTLSCFLMACVATMLT
ncbi:MAG: NupC/NupG family nucleoside CNT transporter [Chthoniobacterales bacterium]